MDLDLLNHGTRKQIFKKLLYSELTFTQLWDKKTRSNRFNYHLNELIKLGLIKKSDNLYSLTNAGKDLAIYADLKDFGIHKQPFVIAGILLRSDDKMLLSRLEREPFKGVWAISVVGRINYGEGIMESAERQCIERTGYTPKDLKLKIIYSIRTREEGRLHSHHLFYIFKCKEYSGAFKAKTSDRTNKWVKITDLKDYNIFTDIPYTLEYIDKPGIHYLELERDYDGKKMGSTKLLK